MKSAIWQTFVTGAKSGTRIPAARANTFIGTLSR
jgi:hypothetical protein